MRNTTSPTRTIAATRAASLATALLLAGILLASCSLSPQVARQELAQVVQRDGVPFDEGRIPPAALDRLAASRVVVVGEFHFLPAHRDLTVELLRQLHARGFRQFLFEWTQAADWLLADYVSDGGLEPEWAPPREVGGEMIDAIRDLNRTLPASEQIGVRGLDLTVEYGGADSFLGSLRALAKHLPEPGPLGAFFAHAYGTADEQEAQIAWLQAELAAQRAALVAAWGQRWYDTVVELVEVEQTSVPIRALRERNYDRSARLREEGIKRLVERRLRDVPQGTLINVGATHAQRKRLWGTDVVWLGEYLALHSEAAAGAVTIVQVAPAHIIAAEGSGLPDQDLSASPENELLRVMTELWPGQLVYLPLDDALFAERKVALNWNSVIYRATLKQHMDIVILLPEAQRVRYHD